MPAEHIYSEKMYIDPTEMIMDMNEIFIKVGQNEYIKTRAINADISGIYVLDNDIQKSGERWANYWRCTYCHHCYPEGNPCNNSACPSRYP